jgi:hypothetical protein
MKGRKITLTGDYFGAGPGLGGIAQITIRQRRARSYIWHRSDLTDRSEPKVLVQTFRSPCSWQDIAMAIATNDALQIPECDPLRLEVCGAHREVIGEVLALCCSDEPFNRIGQVLARCTLNSLERLRASEKSFLRRPFCRWLVRILHMMEEEHEDGLEHLALIIQKLKEDALSLRLIAQEAKQWCRRLRAERRHQEQEIERLLRPFSTSIDLIVAEWRIRNPARSGNEQMGCSIRSGCLRQYLREYVLRERALPSGIHEIPN